MVDQSLRDRAWFAVTVSLLVAIVCALLVSLAAVKLRPYYTANVEAERISQLETIVEPLLGGVTDFTLDDVETRIVLLANGDYDETIDPLTYDARQAASDSESSVVIPPELDIANIGRRPTHVNVFVVRDAADAVRFLILPVWGSGYQSTLVGYVALAGDTSTVLALKFYEHAETPGVGARIDDPDWLAMWGGKQVFDAQGDVRIGVAKGRVSSGSADFPHLVDGLSGATRTSDGVTGLLRYWLGSHGFGPFLDRVRRGEA